LQITAGGQILATEMNSSDFDDKTTKRIVIKFYINLNNKNINKRDSQFGGASRDINTALPRASPQKDPTTRKKKKDKDLEPELRIRGRTRPDKEKKDKEEERQRTKRGAAGPHTLIMTVMEVERWLVRLEWLMNQEEGDDDATSCTITTHLLIHVC